MACWQQGTRVEGCGKLRFRSFEELNRGARLVLFSFLIERFRVPHITQTSIPGASSGLGLQLSEVLAKNGARVISIHR